MLAELASGEHCHLHVKHAIHSCLLLLWCCAGVLIWELVTGLDITDYQPLAMSRQLGLTVGPHFANLPTCKLVSGSGA